MVRITRNGSGGEALDGYAKRMAKKLKISIAAGGAY
jgi:hypothetical protein